MPFSLPTRISRRSTRLSSSPAPGSTRQQKLYFPPGGHTHDRHTIPPDRLHISLSDPVLVAAEERLANEQRRCMPSTIKESSARKTSHLGSAASLPKGEILSQRSGDYNDSALATSPEGTDSSDDSCDIVEIMTIASVIGVLPASENSQGAPHLAPLASETFKEELYIRGYLKRPASRPATVGARKPRTNFLLMSRKVFPKVLGRRQGQKVAETLRAEQNVVETLGGPTNLSQQTSAVASVTLRTPHVDAFESPGTATSISESFDLHEFSYLTAFTTPPSSPSIVLDAETLKKRVDDNKHAV